MSTEALLEAGGSKLGAVAGQALIPIPGVGAAIGGVLGGFAGKALGSLFKSKPKVPPTRGFATTGTFALGGKRYYKLGGKRLFVGPRHEQGGITLENGDEVEGGEVGIPMSYGEYIFSDRIKVPGTNKTFAQVSKHASKKELMRLAGLQEKVTGRLNSLGEKHMYSDGGFADDPTRKILVNPTTGLLADGSMDRELFVQEVPKRQSITAFTLPSVTTKPPEMKMYKPVVIPTIRPDRPLSDAHAQLEINRLIDDPQIKINPQLQAYNPEDLKLSEDVDKITETINNDAEGRTIRMTTPSLSFVPATMKGVPVPVVKPVERPDVILDDPSLDKDIQEGLDFIDARQKRREAWESFKNKTKNVFDKTKNAFTGSMPYWGDIANITSGLLPNRIPKPVKVDRSVLSMMPTRYDVNPQLEANKRAANAIINNSASSPNNRLAALASRFNADSNVYGTKVNAEAQMRSELARMTDSLNARQESYDNQYRQEKMLTEANRINRLVEGLTGVARTSQGLKREQNQKEMDLAALEVYGAAGSRFNPEQMTYLRKLIDPIKNRLGIK